MTRHTATRTLIARRPPLPCSPADTANAADDRSRRPVPRRTMIALATSRSRQLAMAREWFAPRTGFVHLPRARRRCNGDRAFEDTGRHRVGGALPRSDHNRHRDSHADKAAGLRRSAPPPERGRAPPSIAGEDNSGRCEVFSHRFAPGHRDSYGISRTMIRLVAPLAPVWRPAVITTRAPVGRPANSFAVTRADSTRSSTVAPDGHRSRINTPLESQLIGNCLVVRERDDRSSAAVFRARSRRAAERGRDDQRHGVDVVGQLYRGMHHGCRGCVFVH